MISEKIFTYTLTKTDYIEKKQLCAMHSNSFWSNCFSSIVLLSISFLELQRINNPDYLVIRNFNNLAQTQTVEYHLQTFIFTFIGSILIISSNFPKYNPISRWDISRKFNKDFIKQETKTITVNETGITIVSNNYWDLRQWQGYLKFIEGKNIFLLFSEGQTDREHVIFVRKRSPMLNKIIEISTSMG